MRRIINDDTRLLDEIVYVLSVEFLAMQSRMGTLRTVRSVGLLWLTLQRVLRPINLTRSQTRIATESFMLDPSRMRDRVTSLPP